MERIWNVFEICVSENFEKACLGLSIKMASKAAQKDFNPTVYCTVGNTCIYARACARARAYTHTHTHAECMLLQMLWEASKVFTLRLRPLGKDPSLESHTWGSSAYRQVLKL